MFSKVLKKKSIETISQRVLYTILGITVLVFSAFYLLGYDTPFINDASFNAPLLTGGILIWIYVLIILSVVMMLFSLYNSIRNLKIEGKIVNGIHARKITFLVFISLFMLLLLTFFLGSTSSIQINGMVFSDKIWLQVTDMFINTILTMLLVLVGVVVLGTIHNRKLRGKIK